MKFKIDENLPVEIAALLQEAGYDATTILDQELGGSADPRIASACRNEDRALVTRYGFCEHTHVSTKPIPGLNRLRRQDKLHVVRTFTCLIPVFSTEPLQHRLWIVEDDKIRIREWV
ncbi:MAG: DUF5615 family PIN-like protein [Gammaproteobacteria bacterium]|nr:DUF5615 family PIN-like protein [Gammaproteobacteria bacterium]